MYKLFFITVISIVAAVSLVVGMASPAAAFAQQDNMPGGNAASMAGNIMETESLASASEIQFYNTDDNKCQDSRDNTDQPDAHSGECDEGR